MPAPAARPPGDCRDRQAEADLQRGAEGGRPEAEDRGGRGEGASGEADPGGRERALAGWRRTGEDAGAVPRGGEVRCLMLIRLGGYCQHLPRCHSGSGLLNDLAILLPYRVKFYPSAKTTSGRETYERRAQALSLLIAPSPGTPTERCLQNVLRPATPPLVSRGA